MKDDALGAVFFEYHPSSITVCDTEGIIVAMNAASRDNFLKRGSGKLIGTSLFECHPESANNTIRHLLSTESSQTYITENKGRKRLIHQGPWYNNGIMAGLVETIIDLSGEIEVRKRN